MGKEEERLGEGDQEKKGTSIVRRDEAPLSSEEVTTEGNPKALFSAELIEETEIPKSGALLLKKTRIRLRNIMPGAKDQGGETSEPSDTQ